jgi:C1A family cysteine protease
VAFGSSAAVESTLRIASDDPELDGDHSEAFLFYCIAEEQQGRACHGQNGGWWPKEALRSYCDPGVPDEGCFPYTPGDQPCGACDDWRSRVTTIGDWTALQNPDEMRDWLSSHGPIVASMAVYEDFQHYRGGVYQYVSGPKKGGHCICLVGYDDSAGYWIGKNSWNTDWGEGGFFNIRYGECGIDSGALGVQDVRPPS